MKQEQIIVVALRLFAIAIAIWVLRNAPGMVVYLYQQELRMEIISATLGFVIVVLVGLGLWWFPHAIARRIVEGSSTESEEISETWSPKTLQQVGCTILGIYLLYHGISDSFYWLFFYYSAKNDEVGPFDLTFGNWASIYTTGIEIAFSLWLILGSSGIVGTIRTLRMAGRRDQA